MQTVNLPSAKAPWTKEVWYYDYRTNIHHTLKKNPLKLDDLLDFIHCYKPENRHTRKDTFHKIQSSAHLHIRTSILSIKNFTFVPYNNH